MDDDDPEQPFGGGRALVVMLILLVLVAGTLWIGTRLHRADAVQDCVAAGRTNCAPVGR